MVDEEVAVAVKPLGAVGMGGVVVKRAPHAVSTGAKTGSSQSLAIDLDEVCAKVEPSFQSQI